jgi:hypothetical protein
MKRILCTVAVLAIAAGAVAGTGEMTPQMAMEKMMNCPVCSAWNTPPTVGPAIRYSIQETKNGYIETFMSADEKLMPDFEKCYAECEKRVMGIPSMTQEQKDKLCPFCIGHVKMMDRKDLTFESVKTPLGWVTVASSSSAEGTKALQTYASTAKKQADLLEAAGKEMGQKEVQKSKM